MRPERTERSARHVDSSARAQSVHGLYAVTPDLDDTKLLCVKVAAAIDGGARVIQYRNKSLARDGQREQAARLAAICAARRVPFVVNDDPQLARDVDADGVHVGEDDGAIASARAIVGSERIVGASCYDDFARAQSAVANGADYVAFGSFFASTVKPGARRARVELLRRARDLGVPVVAIGGITSANAKTLIDAGASAVAVISDVFAHAAPLDVARHARAIASLFESPPVIDETT